MPRLPRARKGQRAPLDYRPTTINLTPELDDLVDREADAMGVTRSAFVRIALQSWAADSNTPQRAPSESP